MRDGGIGLRPSMQENKLVEHFAGEGVTVALLVEKFGDISASQFTEIEAASA